jgi:hypothetical protein
MNITYECGECDASFADESACAEHLAVLHPTAWDRWYRGVKEEQDNYRRRQI